MCLILVTDVWCVCAQQVHELRVQYKKEWEEKVVANEKLRAERAAEFWSKVEEYRRIRDEKAK